MEVIISGSLLVPVIIYILAFSRYHILYNTALIVWLRSLIDGKLLEAHAVTLGVSLVSAGIAVMTLFYMREQRMAFGSKKGAFALLLLSSVCAAILIVKIGKMLIPLYLHSEVK